MEEFEGLESVATTRKEKGNNIMKKRFAGAVCAIALMIGGTAHAAIHQFQAIMSGSQESPPNGSPGTGTATLQFDDTTNALTLVGNYSGLLGTTTASHIHMAPPGVNGPIIIPLTHTGGQSGTLSGGGILTAAQVTALFNNGLYVNVHTNMFPGGEIRGVITLVPAPGALALLGLAGLAGTGRRRRA
jgi:hypothetical protein